MTTDVSMKANATFARIRLPEKFHRISSFATILNLLHALAFFLVPAIVAWFIVDLPMSTPIRVTLAIVLGLIGGHGMHLLIFVGHEGLHTNLHRNKYVSATLALLWSSVVPFFFIIGFGVTHWKHHRFTDHEIDPDAEVFSKYKNFMSRMLIARSKLVRIYLKNTACLAFGLNLPEDTKLPFSEREMRWIARGNIFLGLCALVVYFFIWRRSIWLGFTVMLIPYFALYVFTSMRAYIEHTGTVPGRYRDSRSYTSPIYTALFFGNNFHLEHHLYPAVPSYRLPALHNYLVSKGLIEATGAQVEPSFFGALRYTTGHFPYPRAKLQSTADDFIEQIADGRFDRKTDLANAVDTRDNNVPVAAMNK